MNITVKKRNSYCIPESILMDGKELDLYDFGSMEDLDICNRPQDGGCGNQSFVRKEATSEVLHEYNITLEEYEKICNTLEDELQWGRCAYCS